MDLHPSTPSISFIYNELSIPEKNSKWKDEFLYLVWKGVIGAPFFTSSFEKVSNENPKKIVLNAEVQVAFEALRKDDG